jgi:hypothetical protein
MKSHILSRLRVLAIFMLALPMFGVGAGANTSYAQGDSHTFPETGHTVKGKFWAYWQTRGALAQQGYPITDEMSEVSETDGKTYTVQYFQRSEFQLHP